MSSRMRDADVCIVGGGPAGVMLGLLLARTGLSVEVVDRLSGSQAASGADLVGRPTLEAYRAVLGDDGLRAVPRRMLGRTDLVVDGVRLHVDPGEDDDARAVLPRDDLLAALMRAGAALPTFTMSWGTTATGLRRAGGAVTGLTAVDAQGPLEVRARLTVAMDGQRSTIRSAAGLSLRPAAGSAEVLWVGAGAESDAFTAAIVGRGQVLLGGVDDGRARLGLLLEPGGGRRLRDEGLARTIDMLTAVPGASARGAGQARSWDDLDLQPVELGRIERWHLPGLLMLGDAAHPVSPLLGVGSDLALHDAVAAANRLAGPLREGWALEPHLVAVERRRSGAAELTQSLQLSLHVGLATLAARRSLHSPPTALERAALRAALPPLRSTVPRLLRRGLRPEVVAPAPDVRITRLTLR